MGGSRVGTPGAGTQSKPWVEPHPMKQAQRMGLRWFTWIPPKKIGEDQFVGSHGFFQNGAKTTASCILYVLFVYIFWPFIVLPWGWLSTDGTTPIRDTSPETRRSSQQLPYHLQKNNNLCRCSSRLVFYDESIWKHSQIRSTVMLCST